MRLTLQIVCYVLLWPLSELWGCRVPWRHPLPLGVQLGVTFCILSVILALRWMK